MAEHAGGFYVQFSYGEAKWRSTDGKGEGERKGGYCRTGNWNPRTVEPWDCVWCVGTPEGKVCDAVSKDNGDMFSFFQMGFFAD